MKHRSGSFCVKTIPVIQSDLRGVLLVVVSYPDKVAGGGEGRPGDVKPAGAGQQLVGIVAGAEEVNQSLELLRVPWTDVGSLAEQVLRVADSADLPVVGLVAVAAIDDDGSYLAAGGLQQILAAVLQVEQHLQRGQVVGVLLQVEKLCQLKMLRQSDVIELCVFH